jgi:hypothetical protein
VYWVNEPNSNTNLLSKDLKIRVAKLKFGEILFHLIRYFSKKICITVDLAVQAISVLFFNLCGGALGTAATTGLLYQPRMIGDGDCGEIRGMKIGRGNCSSRRKLAPAPLCPQ